MNAKEATVKAKQLFGRMSFAVRVSSRDRNQRFGVMIAEGNKAMTLGYGPSFEEAFKMAESDVMKMLEEGDENHLITQDLEKENT